MTIVENKVTQPLTKNNLGILNNRIQQALNRQTILDINEKRSKNPYDDNYEENLPVIQPKATNDERPIPRLFNELRRGQKHPLALQNTGVKRIKVCFGWNVKDGKCEIDASAFLVNSSGKVPDDSWFVFYGQERSPDQGVIIDSGNVSGEDREVIQVNLDRIAASIQKIVFVLTIHEAFERGLNFSMIKDAYVRLLDERSGQEILSYRVDEYYPTVTSMTIGELYLHSGQWKFNPVGNGVHQDLAGQCAIYGVDIC